LLDLTLKEMIYDEKIVSLAISFVLVFASLGSAVAKRRKRVKRLLPEKQKLL